MHAEESTHRAVNPEDADVRERSMRFSGDPGQWDEIKLVEIQVGDDILEMCGNEIKVAETQVGDQILETCGGNDIKFAETQVGDQFLGTDGTQATSLVA